MVTTDSGTIGAALARARALLTTSGCDDPGGDAVTIIASVLKVPVSDLERHHSDQVPEGASLLLDERLTRRSQREPIEYVVGWCWFRGLRLSVDRRVLVPQESFGTFVELALALPNGARVHDVGTGSGAIALAVKNERTDLTVSGSDISPAAIDVARANARRLDLDVPFEAVPGLPPGEYDLVLANLPYQDDGGQTLVLPPEETVHQPHVAIFGGADGLDVIRDFLGGLPPHIRVAVGHAPSQATAVRALFSDSTTAENETGSRCMTVGSPLR